MAHARLLWMTAAATLALMAIPALGADPVAGDARAGKALFTGARRMQNGGAPCGACHAIGVVGAASLGPDLSRSFEGMAPDAIDGLLQDLPFPTMTPIYAGRALTATERADLAAFLAASTAAPVSADERLGATALVLAVVGMAALGFAGRRRKRPTRGQLTPRAPYARDAAGPSVRASTEPAQPELPAARASGGTR